MSKDSEANSTRNSLGARRAPSAGLESARPPAGGGHGGLARSQARGPRLRGAGADRRAAALDHLRARSDQALAVTAGKSAPGPGTTGTAMHDHGNSGPGGDTAGDDDDLTDSRTNGGPTTNTRAVRPGHSHRYRSGRHAQLDPGRDHRHQHRHDAWQPRDRRDHPRRTSVQRDPDDPSRPDTRGTTRGPTHGTNTGTAAATPATPPVVVRPRASWMGS